MARDTLAVFDGNAFLLFDARGTFVDRWAWQLREALNGAFAFSRRVRVVEGGLLFDLEERSRRRADAESGERPYHVWHALPDGVRPVLALVLPPLPRLQSGARHHGSREAVPLWDATAECLVFSDGSSPRMIRASLERTEVDTMAVPLPDRNSSANPEEQDLLQRLGARPRKQVEPTLPIRVQDLIVDPDGWVWLWLLRPDAVVSEEILRVRLSDGHAETDTVPAFPRAFGLAGEYFASVRDTSGTWRLAHFARGN